MTNDDLGDLRHKIDDVFSVVVDIQTQVAVIADRCPHHYAALEKHEATLYGNGRKGMTTRLELVEQRVRSMPGQLSKKAWAAIIGGIATLATGLSTIVSSLAK